jgi:small-conductance mechanosensitive channel
MQLELLKAASERIECTTEAVASWQAVEREAADQVERASADLMKLQLSSSIAIATSPVERAAERRHDLKTLKRATEIAVAEVRRAGAVLAQRLLTRVAAANKTDPRADRTALKAQMADLDAKTVLLGEHGERTRQLRSAIAVEQAASDEPAVEQGYAAARKELAALEAALEDLAAQLERARQLARMLDARLLAREGAVGQGVRMVREGVSSGWSEAHALLARPLFEVNETPVTTLGLIRVAVILTLAWWLSRLLRGALARLSRNNLAFSPASLYAVGRVLHYLLLLLGFVVGLSSIGVDLTKFALFASALGVGVGFGLQTLISNFVAGLIILFEKSLNVGDFIELESGKTGEVVEINMRATRITTNDNVDILVPNAEFMNTKVTNWTLRDSVRRVHVPFSVAYGTDKELVREAALAAAAQVDHTLTEANRQAQVWLVRFGESSLDFELVVWLNLRAIKRPGSVLSDYLWALESELVARRIEIPFPQRELRWHGAFAGQGRGAQT